MRRPRSLLALLALLLILAVGCEQGSSWIQTTCKLDDQPATRCDFDWQTNTGKISYSGLAPGPHRVTITAQRWTLVSKNPDVWKSSPVGETSREWTVAP